MGRIPAEEMAAIIRESLPPSLPIGIPLAIAEWESGSVPADRTGYRVNVTGPELSYSDAARGVWQIVPKFARDYGLSDPADADDPRKATPGVLRKLVRNAELLRKISPAIDPDALAALVYYGHAEGAGALERAAREAAATGPLTLGRVLLLRRTKNAGRGFSYVGKRWRFWQDQYGEVS